MQNDMTMLQEQDAISAKGFHPLANFIASPKEVVQTSIPSCFEVVTRAHRHRVAIKTKDRSITYDALNKAANRIGAAILERLGPRNEPVALLFGNGIDSIAALLGTLKAGKCFIAIDPSFPLPRIQYMLRDTEARLIVTNGENLDLMKELVGPGCAGINVDETRHRGSGENLGLTISPEDIATIVYTSGSTAEPKGVVKTHGYCLERAEFNVDFLSVRPDDRLSLLHSVSFGSAEINLYASLLTGASLLPFDVKQAGVAGLVQWLTSERITVFHCAPSLFRQFIESNPMERQFPHLRLLHLSGSPITRADFDEYKRCLSHGAELAFHMGATEAGCIASAVVDGNFSFPERGTPAGFTRTQKKVLILDNNGDEAKPGDIGEIGVQSRYLAQGYWKNPQLTQAKFKLVPNCPSERMYLTGDLGQLNSDGFLVHMGRKDFMVKIRGYRVELGEIEKALVDHPEIKEAALVAREREAGEFYLAAYLVLQTGSTIPIDRLGAFLRQRLPDYMIPSTFSFLDSMPLTNGKLDRRALPIPATQRPEMTLPCEAPRSALEQTVATIWANVLGVDTVGIHDNFFDLGGHSLLATQIVFRIRNAFSIELPLRQLFESPTVAEMAIIITDKQAKRTSETVLAQMFREVDAMTDEEAQKQIGESRMRN